MTKYPHAAIVAMTGLASMGLAAPIAVPLKPLIIWNASASAPIGLYRVLPGPRLLPGDLVAVRLPDWAAEFAAERGYLPGSIPAVKRVAAAAGNVVCARSSTIMVDGRAAGTALPSDARARPLPRWSGCHQLRDGEIFLLNQAPESFDSRYFGPVPSRAVIGRLVALWTW